jgi:hypothetical protein
MYFTLLLTHRFASANGFLFLKNRNKKAPQWLRGLPICFGLSLLHQHKNPAMRIAYRAKPFCIDM